MGYINSYVAWIALASVLESTLTKNDIFGQEKYIVLKISRLGLANRLRSLADWYSISVVSNRSLLVSWEPTLDCNITLPAFIHYIPPPFKLLSFYLPHDDVDSETLVSTIAAASNLTYMNLDHGNSGGFFMRKNSVIMSDIDVLYTSYDGIVILENMTCQQYMSMRMNFYALIKAKEATINFVNDIIEQYFVGKIMIGIHIRIHDRRYDWEVVPPIFGEKNAVSFGTGASVEDFITIMHQIQNKFRFLSPKGEEIPTIRFFVASNDHYVKSKILR